MFKELKIAAIQTNILWENILGNLSQYDEMLQNISEDVMLIVLPEMFATGFTMHPENCAETMDGSSVNWMQDKAKELNKAIMGSLVIQERENYYNRMVFVYPNGALRYYDKRHLFTLAGEDKKYTPGMERLIFDYKGWKICPMICYDLRFPVWSRNTKNYDVLIYMANWPKPRINAWDTLLKARAIENMSYVVGVNRIGFDENNYEFNGHSQAIDPLGKSIGNTSENSPEILEVILDKNKLNTLRNKFQFLNDRDSFEVY
ncbi:amidohydrolase [Urechidicola vernalis]|uniref:Amidohydrolase n=1 Tax=Urechidicola vernalis TaxID=3075600 RepID=A0ABU2Y745_9FLAO|nr:amidohydrolase [Urechidicola sp. P050]MDT0554016.1 amidohydrolase [Urechidicola sp. P050]